MILSDIHIRDPFVLPVSSERRYYLYGTMGEYAWTESAVGFDCYISADLQTWEGPFPVFRPPAGFWADRNFWAPEVHAYRGRYFLFASFKAEGICRGTQILAAESPRGPFRPVSAGAGHSPGLGMPGWHLVRDCRRPSLDGVLSRVGAGRRWRNLRPASERRPGLRRGGAGRVVPRFAGALGPANRVEEDRKGCVTDGPWLHRLPNGELLMLWSSFSADGYTIGVARSASGQLLGPWRQDARPLYSEDGGHCMTFRDFEGNLRLCFHHPNRNPDERPMFLPLAEDELASPRS